MLDGLMAKTSSSKKKYHHGDLKLALLDEGAKILQNEGEVGLSMRKLATDLGVSRTALYHHFRDKDDLLCAIAEEGFRRFTARVTPDGMSSSERSRDLGFDKIISNYLSFATDNAHYYDLMFSGRLWKSQILTMSLKEAAYASFKTFVELVEVWQSVGNGRKDIEALRLAQVAWSTLHGLSRLLIDGIYVDQSSVDVISKNILHIYGADK